MKLVQRPGLARFFFVVSALLFSTGAPSQTGARRSPPLARQPRPGTSTVSVTPTPQPASSARREWEAMRDWTAFASNVVGDTAVKDSLKRLLDSGLDVNAPDKQGRTALHVAATLGQTEMARYLLSRGATVDARDHLGRTPLMVSASLGGLGLPADFTAPWSRFWTDRLCPERGNDSPSGRTPEDLMRWYAVAPAHPPLVRLLIGAGAEVNAADSQGQTVLDHAGMGGLTEIDRLVWASGRVRGGRQCELKVGQAPALRGFRLGMTLLEVSSRFPRYALPEADSCARLNFSLDTATGRLGAYARRPEEFAGVSRLDLAFFDGRLAYLRLTYDRSTSWGSTDEYLAALSGALGLPASWHKAGEGTADHAHVVGCDGFKVMAGQFGGPVRGAARRGGSAGDAAAQSGRRRAEGAGGRAGAGAAAAGVQAVSAKDPLLNYSSSGAAGDARSAAAAAGGVAAMVEKRIRLTVDFKVSFREITPEMVVELYPARDPEEVLRDGATLEHVARQRRLLAALLGDEEALRGFIACAVIDEVVPGDGRLLREALGVESEEQVLGPVIGRLGGEDAEFYEGAREAGVFDDNIEMLFRGTPVKCLGARVAEVRGLDDAGASGSLR